MLKRLSLPAHAVDRARALRRAATPAERAMRRLLKANFPEVHFRFQVPFGSYYADFVSHRARVVIEVDGESHGGSGGYDAARTAFLEGEGYQVLRFWNREVLSNPEGVAVMIGRTLAPPPPCGEGRVGASAASAAEKTAAGAANPSGAQTRAAPTSRPPHKGEEANRQTAFGVR